MFLNFTRAVHVPSFSLPGRNAKLSAASLKHNLQRHLQYSQFGIKDKNLPVTGSVQVIAAVRFVQVRGHWKGRPWVGVEVTVGRGRGRDRGGQESTRHWVSTGLYRYRNIIYSIDIEQVTQIAAH